MSSSLFCVISHHSIFERLHRVECARTLIGRSDDSAIWLPDPIVSREHAVLSWQEGTVAKIQDLGSRNGTHVDDRRISTEASVGEGSRIRIGPYRLRICLSLNSAIRQIAELCARASTTNPKLNHLNKLDREQRELYDEFADTWSEEEVGQRLRISTDSVRLRADALYKSLAITSRDELVARWASGHGHDPRG